ncbi:MAG TPA: arsinothricin resistance N-acetyltransferase ArsN1 family B [Vicinamibacterales bacterium]|nr:arsinothricin resistance N-acetyltransferase ArsN1 family B [Vicinamibacterales bacterium]
MALIRLASPADAAGIAAIYGPYCEQGAISFETVAPSAEDMARRIGNIVAERPWLVLEDAGALIGYAYASPHHERAAYRWTVSTAIYVSSANRGRGVGRALYTTLFELLRHLGYFKATAGITLPNEASVGLHEAFGFTPVGVYRDVGYKLGAWRDVGWYEASIQPLVPDPPAPRPISALEGTLQWAAAMAKGLAQLDRKK